MVEGGVEGGGVEAEFGVGEVVFVGEDEGGVGSGVGVRGVLGDVCFVAFAQGEGVVVGGVVVVDADGGAVGAGAVVVEGEGPVVGGGGGFGGGGFGGEGVDAGGAEPGVGPGVDVAVGGGGEVVDEVGEGGVAEFVAGEVAVDAGEEVFFADPGDELAEG